MVCAVILERYFFRLANLTSTTRIWQQPVIHRGQKHEAYLLEQLWFKPGLVRFEQPRNVQLSTCLLKYFWQWQTSLYTAFRGGFNVVIFSIAQLMTNTDVFLGVFVILLAIFLLIKVERTSLSAYLSVEADIKWTRIIKSMLNVRSN